MKIDKSYTEKRIEQINRQMGVRLWWVVMISYCCALITFGFASIYSKEPKEKWMYVAFLIWTLFWAIKLYRFGKKRGVIK